MTCYSSLSADLRDDDNPTVEKLMQNFLGQVEVISGDLQIVRSTHLTNLSFFSNLKSIYGYVNPAFGVM